MSQSSMQLETVNVHTADAAATIELNRPEALNAWNAQFGADLRSALAAQAVPGPLFTFAAYLGAEVQ